MMRMPAWIGMAALVGATVMFSGCGVGQKQLDNAKLRIDSLQAKGVPDTMLDDAQLLLAKLPGAIKYEGGAAAKRQADSMFALITTAEAWVANAAQTLKPKTDQMRAAAETKKKELTGEQLKVADSCLAVVDATAKSGQVTQAFRKMSAFADTILPVLVADEQKAKEFGVKVVGKWLEVHQAEGKGLNAVERKTYAIKGDGTFEIDDAMKGKSAESLQEDWQYISSGKWVMKGDTVLLNVTRDRCTRMVLQNLVDGKWKKNEKPGYDSTFTDGHKDIALPWQYMSENLKKGK
jgi:hypothetical protein